MHSHSPLGDSQYPVSIPVSIPVISAQTAVIIAWEQYKLTLPKTTCLSACTISNADTVFKQVVRVHRTVAPDACPGEQDILMFWWDRNEHHLECEVVQDTLEFFYRNRETQELWEELSNVNMFLKNPSPELIKKLVLFKTKL